MNLRNITWTSELGLVQIVILIAFIVGYIIIFFYQRNKIKGLEDTVKKMESLSGLIERYMKIFSVDEIEKYVKLSKETTQMEMVEEERKKMKSELKKKGLEKMDYTELLNEYWELFGFQLDIIYNIPYSSIVEISIDSMRDSFSKKTARARLEKVRAELKSEGITEKQFVRYQLLREIYFMNEIRKKTKIKPKDE